MNTEPPEGDDLQRMLVSMKQHVLERATPRPARRRGRSGIVVGVVALLALGTATGAIALTLTQQDRPDAAPAQTKQPEPEPSASTPVSAPITGRPTPTPTSASTPSTTASIPTDCRSVVPASEYERLFGAAEPMLISGVGTETGPGYPVTDLYCLWGSNSGWSGLALTMGTLIPGQATGADAITFGDREATCTDELGGSVCRVTFVPEGGGTQTRTRFERGGTWIEVDQSNFPTNGLLPAIVGEVWGD